MVFETDRIGGIFSFSVSDDCMLFLVQKNVSFGWFLKPFGLVQTGR